MRFFQISKTLSKIDRDNEIMTTPNPLPVPVCSIVGDVLGSFIFNHRKLEALFYEAAAVGDVPPGNCVEKCRNWLKRMDEDVPDPAAVLGKILEEFMEVERSFDIERQPKKDKRCARPLRPILPQWRHHSRRRQRASYQISAADLEGSRLGGRRQGVRSSPH
jgi:hypothetical protein